VQLVFRFIANRYEKASTVITSNKAFSEWTEMFHDPVIVTVILDRLLHHSPVVNIRGNSFRLRGETADKHPDLTQGKGKSGSLFTTEIGILLNDR
jgi:DNA replication protein DnaC